VRDCVSTFPSVTPVAAASIATGLGPADHHIPAMNWYHRGERRYVEYGSSFDASRAVGVFRSLQDTVYNMNMAHLNREHRTVFEALQDDEIRTAGTTYLMYRGRKRHTISADGMYPRLARAGGFRHAIWGPDEFFYADLFASRKTDCRSALGMPGQRDQHTGCVGAYLVEHDLCDFMLASLPDNDTYSHKRGPYAQVTSIASADRALERIMHAAGGVDEFLEEHAVIVMSDHSQIAVVDEVNLAQALGKYRLLLPDAHDDDEAEIAVCPSQRSAQVYVLDPERADEMAPRIAQELNAVDGVDIVMWRDGDEAAVLSGRGEMRFAPGGDLTDERGGTWSVEGSLETLVLDVRDGRVSSAAYPDSLERVWSALACPQSGDVLVSAGGGYEFNDWGGVAHVGGGSHGSLHRGDSLGVLLFAGTGPRKRDAPDLWRIRDVTPMALDHFSVPS
jgi:hypothetical protein